MIYYKAKGKCSFFGEDFIEGELLTGKEMVKWVKKQLNRQSYSNILDFIQREFSIWNINSKHTYFCFGARFEKY